ncbi:hypothetical protein AAFF_G00244760 [Aldrovandia affinis]|uniref:Uncharacterized protein n=1 Tax=Aldrovandia affinis TaxID=143900 RepID=A0AAD7RDN9_9TELE|nr:hypothetical protein AAFF_G00244760 [Aldrovandia affinis]
MPDVTEPGACGENTQGSCKEPTLPMVSQKNSVQVEPLWSNVDTGSIVPSSTCTSEELKPTQSDMPTPTNLKGGEISSRTFVLRADEEPSDAGRDVTKPGTDAGLEKMAEASNSSRSQAPHTECLIMEDIVLRTPQSKTETTLVPTKIAQTVAEGCPHTADKQSQRPDPPFHREEKGEEASSHPVAEMAGSSLSDQNKHDLGSNKNGVTVLSSSTFAHAPVDFPSRLPSNKDDYQQKQTASVQREGQPDSVTELACSSQNVNVYPEGEIKTLITSNAKVHGQCSGNNATGPAASSPEMSPPAKIEYHPRKDLILPMDTSHAVSLTGMGDMIDNPQPAVKLPDAKRKAAHVPSETGKNIIQENPQPEEKQDQRTELNRQDAETKLRPSSASVTEKEMASQSGQSSASVKDTVQDVPKTKPISELIKETIEMHEKSKHQDRAKSPETKPDGVEQGQSVKVAQMKKAFDTPKKSPEKALERKPTLKKGGISGRRQRHGPVYAAVKPRPVCTVEARDLGGVTVRILGDKGRGFQHGENIGVRGRARVNGTRYGKGHPARSSSCGRDESRRGGGAEADSDP